jgi:hypothetical protein
MTGVSVQRQQEHQRLSSPKRVTPEARCKFMDMPGSRAQSSFLCDLLCSVRFSTETNGGYQRPLPPLSLCPLGPCLLSSLMQHTLGPTMLERKTWGTKIVREK